MAQSACHHAHCARPRRFRARGHDEPTAHPPGAPQLQARRARGLERCDDRQPRRRDRHVEEGEARCEAQAQGEGEGEGGEPSRRPRPTERSRASRARRRGPSPTSRRAAHDATAEARGRRAAQAPRPAAAARRSAAASHRPPTSRPRRRVARSPPRATRRPSSRAERARVCGRRPRDDDAPGRARARADRPRRRARRGAVDARPPAQGLTRYASAVCRVPSLGGAGRRAGRRPDRRGSGRWTGRSATDGCASQPPASGRRDPAPVGGPSTCPGLAAIALRSSPCSARGSGAVRAPSPRPCRAPAARRCRRVIPPSTGAGGYGEPGKRSVLVAPTALVGEVVRVRGTMPGAARRRVILQRLDPRRGWRNVARTRVHTDRALRRRLASGPQRAHQPARRHRRAARAPPQSAPVANVNVYRPGARDVLRPRPVRQQDLLRPGPHARCCSASRTAACRAARQVAILFDRREIIVPVVDRGPFNAGYDWDLTQATADALGFTASGSIGYVRVEAGRLT